MKNLQKAVNTRKKGEITHFYYQTLNLGNCFVFSTDSIEIWYAGVKWYDRFFCFLHVSRNVDRFLAIQEKPKTWRPSWILDPKKNLFRSELRGA